MSLERYNQIIDEVYDNYLNEYKNLIKKLLLSQISKESLNDLKAFYKGPINGYQDFRAIASPYLKKEFINNINTNTLFSEKFGLKITERELSREERYVWYKANTHLIPQHFRKQAKEFEDKYVPKKLITLTYNNETIEFYEI